MEDAAWFWVFFGSVSPHGVLSRGPLGWGLRGHPQLCPLPAPPPSPSLPPRRFSGLLRARRTQTSSRDLARAVSKIPAAPWGGPRGALGSAPFPFCSSPGFYGKNPARFRSGLALFGCVPGGLGCGPRSAAASKPREGGGESGFRATRRRGCKVILGEQKSGRKRWNRARIWGDGAGITQRGCGDATRPRSAASPGPSIPGRVGTAGAGCDPGLKKKKHPKGIGLKASCGRRRLFFCSWPGGKPGNRRHGQDKSLPCTGEDKKWHGGDAPRGGPGKSRSGQAKAMVNSGLFSTNACRLKISLLRAAPFQESAS